MFRCILFILLAIGATVVTAPAQAGDPVMRMTMNNDGHLRRPFRERADPDYIPPYTRFVQPARVYVFKDTIASVAKEEPRLSHLCQRGAFIQQMDGIYWAETPERRYGVAFSGGANLSDPQNKRQPGTVYFFERQDSLCRVYTARQDTVMKAFTAPRSVPPIAGPTGIPALVAQR